MILMFLDVPYGAMLPQSLMVFVCPILSRQTLSHFFLKIVQTNLQHTCSKQGRVGHSGPGCGHINLVKVNEKCDKMRLKLSDHCYA